jgi:hypothetical protein
MTSARLLLGRALAMRMGEAGRRRVETDSVAKMPLAFRRDRLLKFGS